MGRSQRARQTASQPVSVSVSQSVSQSVCQPVSQCVSQSVSQCVSQSVSQTALPTGPRVPLLRPLSNRSPPPPCRSRPYVPALRGCRRPALPFRGLGGPRRPQRRERRGAERGRAGPCAGEERRGAEARSSPAGAGEGARRGAAPGHGRPPRPLRPPRGRGRRWQKTCEI